MRKLPGQPAQWWYVVCGACFCCTVSNSRCADEVDVDCGGSCIPCPTCFDYVQNGFEEGVDCGGACEACVLAGDLDWWENVTVSGELVPEPEPEDTGANAAIYSGSSCDGMSMIECVQDGANFQSWYAKENNPFYPWEPGSMAYSNFNWMEYDSWHNGSHPEHPDLPFMENAHVLYG